MCGLIYIYLRLNDVIIKKIFGAQNLSPFFNTSRSLFHIHIDRCGFFYMIIKCDVMIHGIGLK